MPYVSKSRFLETEQGEVNFTYECWANHQGDGLVTVQGQDDAAHLYLIQHRAEVAALIQSAEKLTTMRYCESQGNGSHTEISFETERQGQAISTPTTRAGLSSRELSRQGQRLLDQAEEHKMNLTAHEFTPQQGIERDTSGRRHD